ncbi:hypothetical protein [Agromyces ramosus]|uniref:hypothetical protein n=1 Tax=Agromyces ramosus TaxID=33879 RepID=UPI00102CA0DF|nr:hypothetical protein [Agromyces ramosus]
MARRRELSDVADGISGHFVFDSPANPDWPLAHVAQAVRAGAGTAYSFDMIAGTAKPASGHVRSVSEMLQRDLARHLGVRHLPREWVREASLTVDIEASTPGTVAPVRCQVRILDDRGIAHTTTRRGRTTIPARVAPARLRRWFHRLFSARDDRR